MRGTIVSVFEKRAFAFIKREDNHEEVFAHISDFPSRKLLPVGSVVTFETAAFNGRIKCVKIQPLEVPADVQHPERQ
jgi:cold shock CspA family protein